MAVTVSLYNQAAKLLADSSLDLSAFKLTLHNTQTFTATHTAWADVSATEIAGGTGYTANGVTLGSVAVTTVTTNDAKLTADNVSLTATGGSIGPATQAIIREATANKLLLHIDFGGSQEAGTGTDFKINWNASGIITFTVA